ncbi:MAG: GGDEF domain-containing protein, partial [Spirochaetaceae bacterium]|nr:GGDEF domain-containing protein [Spirochaetaceae bacterium]
GSSEGFMIVAHDVTELERLAREDMLTGLLNRHSWNIAADTELIRLSRHNRFASVIYLDLDYFKKVNDTYGHAAGDKVLMSVGEILKAGVRRPDLVGRYGGEEFVIFLPESNPEGALEVAERLRADLEAAVIESGGKRIPLTGSFGVSGCLITADINLETLVNQADKALFEAKHAGRNKVSLYS